MTRKHLIAFLCVAFAGAALDLVSKHYAFAHVRSPFDEVEVVDGFFFFGRTVNSGIIFGWGQGWSTLFLFVSVLAVPVIALIFLRLRAPTWTVTVSLGLILAGTLGNLWDRAFSMAGYQEFLGMFGDEIGVRDFIKFQFGEKTFPLFNLADSSICVGVGILSVEMMLFDEGKKKKKKKPEDAVSPPGGDETLPVPMARGVDEEGVTEEAPTVGEETAPIPRPEEKTSDPGEDPPGRQ